MNKKITALLTILAIVAFTSGAAFAGAKMYIPPSAEVDQPTGWVEVDTSAWNPGLAWEHKMSGDLNNRDNRASVYIPFSAEVDQPRTNDTSDLPSLVLEEDVLQSFDSESNQASIYIPCSAEATTC